MTTTRTSLPRCNAIGCARPANGYCAQHQPHSYGAEPVSRSVKTGDTEESCDHCRYFTGHASWCRMGKARRS